MRRGTIRCLHGLCTLKMAPPTARTRRRLSRALWLRVSCVWPVADDSQCGPPGRRHGRWHCGTLRCSWSRNVHSSMTSTQRSLHFALRKRGGAQDRDARDGFVRMAQRPRGKLAGVLEGHGVGVISTAKHPRQQSGRALVMRLLHCRESEQRFTPETAPCPASLKAMQTPEVPKFRRRCFAGAGVPRCHGLSENQFARAWSALALGSSRAHQDHSLREDSNSLFVLGCAHGVRAPKHKVSKPDRHTPHGE